jgi:hypothetical protein
MAADAMSGGLKGAFSGEGHRQLGAGGSRKKSRRRELHPRPAVRKRLSHILLRHGPCGWPEHGREEEALPDLVANWHRLTPSVRTAWIWLVAAVGRRHDECSELTGALLFRVPPQGGYTSLKRSSGWCTLTRTGHEGWAGQGGKQLGARKSQDSDSKK